MVGSQQKDQNSHFCPAIPNDTDMSFWIVSLLGLEIDLANLWFLLIDGWIRGGRRWRGAKHELNTDAVREIRKARAKSGDATPAMRYTYSGNHVNIRTESSPHTRTGGSFFATLSVPRTPAPCLGQLSALAPTFTYNWVPASSSHIPSTRMRIGFSNFLLFLGSFWNQFYSNHLLYYCQPE